MQRGAGQVLGAIALWAMAGLGAVLHAAELSATAVKEVAQLLERIEASNCAFMRNGSWYTSAEARKHLQRKLDYMVERKMLGSAEQFITDTASASSWSGKPYMVRCGSAEPMPSAAWLNAELRRIRTPS
jgi:hypothetical protein